MAMGAPGRSQPLGAAWPSAALPGAAADHATLFGTYMSLPCPDAPGCPRMAPDGPRMALG